MSIDKRNGGCDPTQSTVTEWQSKAEVIKGNPKSFVCKGKEWPQACYHYYSVIENNPKFASLTCHNNADRHDGIATDDWKKQHTLPTFTKSYMPKELINVDVRGNGKSVTTVLCDRDEYPPAYFMPNVPKAQNTGQIVRWLPQGENKGAGSIWKEFCEKFDGGEGNGRFHKQDSPGGIKKGDLNMNNVETSVGAIKKRIGNDKSTTTTTTIHATYTRAVFSMKFDNNWPLKPDKANNWGLEENPCWPKAIVPEDPGFVLLTDDNWYKTADGAWADIDKARANVKAELYAKKPKAKDQAAQAAMKARIAAADAIKATWKRGLPSLDLEVLDDGLGIRNANTSERLDARKYEVIECETADCANERRGLNADEIAAILPGRNAELVEPVPADAVATSVPQTLVKVVRAETGSGVRAELPRATAV
ncbi:uncharacterized protein N0V89_006088 [Didymosphaeria variabile]|uniref:Uncharacterized protein n=1 Tax=Didymosphaeria variabile TaxID=1932322 RepID=A0A9W9CCC6_9PLEO|nr:uncharacterized protein N0V89_006088 [Didymosphaeria variabile]KAJ4354353.1 hypothetical protein N0V89_006088 [Didymosphaeria variabile]